MRKLVLVSMAVLGMGVSLCGCTQSSSVKTEAKEVKIEISDARSLELKVEENLVMVHCLNESEELVKINRYHMETGLWDEYDEENPDEKLVNEYHSVFYRIPGNEQKADPDYFYLMIVPENEVEAVAVAEETTDQGTIELENKPYHIITWESDEFSNESLHIF